MDYYMFSLVSVAIMNPNDNKLDHYITEEFILKHLILIIRKFPI